MKNNLVSILSIQKQKELSQMVMATNTVVGKLLKIMKSHIGQENKISRMKLFKKIYGISENEVNEFQVFILWEVIKKAMHKCRQRTKCQIISKAFKHSKYSTQGGVWSYWVACEFSDAKIYREGLRKNIKAMIKAMSRMEKSVSQSWYKLDWTENLKLN